MSVTMVNSLCKQYVGHCAMCMVYMIYRTFRELLYSSLQVIRLFANSLLFYFNIRGDGCNQTWDLLNSSTLTLDYVHRTEIHTQFVKHNSLHIYAFYSLVL